MGCILRVLGDNFDPDDFLQTSRLQPYSVFKKGELSRIRNKTSQCGGFNCNVSDSDQLAKQIEDAVAFMKEYQFDLTRLLSYKNIEESFFDFGFDCLLVDESVCVQTEYFPPDALIEFGKYRLGICLTLLPAPSNETQRNEDIYLDQGRHTQGDCT